MNPKCKNKDGVIGLCLAPDQEEANVNEQILKIDLFLNLSLKLKNTGKKKKTLLWDLAVGQRREQTSNRDFMNDAGL